MKLFEDQTRKAIIGMVHLRALPGSPRVALSVSQITQIALAEALLYQKAGVDSILLENMHDIPYLKRVAPPETVAAFAIVAAALRAEIEMPIGIQVLAGANEAALAIAQAAGLDYIRAEGFVFGHLADEGYMDADAPTLLRYRKALGAEQIKIYCDIKKKHSSHALTADISIGETAKAAEFFLSDGLIVTGSSTAEGASTQDLVDCRAASALPLMIGSGITDKNLADYWQLADGFIVGSHFKEGGYWANEISASRLESFMKKVGELRG